MELLRRPAPKLIPAPPHGGGDGTSTPRRSRILYVTHDDPSRSDWLHGYYLATAFREQLGNVALFGPPPRRAFDHLRFGARKIVTARLAGTVFNIAFEPPVVRYYAQEIRRVARQVDAALVFCNNPIPVALLGSSTPYVIHTDATVSGLQQLGYYLDGTSSRSLRNWLHFDRAAVLSAAAVFFSSEWAAGCAIDDYGADPAKVYVVPQGANLDVPPVDEDTIDRGPGEVCRLLFYGSDWTRKGGEVAYETLKALERRGVPALLRICGPGTLPDGLAQDTSVEFVPRVDKNDPVGAAKLFDLFRHTDFVVLPTRADCTPVAISEAAVFGVPSVASDVGGIPSMIDQGVNGYTLPLHSSADDYAAVISRVFGDDQAFRRLRREARRNYLERLNWGVAVREIEAALLERGLIQV